MQLLKNVPEGSLKWYKIAGWVVLYLTKTKKYLKRQRHKKEVLEEVKDETNTKANVTS